MEHPERVLMIECLDFYPFYHSELHWRIGLVGRAGCVLWWCTSVMVQWCNGAMVQGWASPPWCSGAGDGDPPSHPSHPPFKHSKASSIKWVITCAPYCPPAWCEPWQRLQQKKKPKNPPSQVSVLLRPLACFVLCCAL